MKKKVEKKPVDEERRCWICLEAKSEDSLWKCRKRRWIRPCLCRGDTKWVHEECLLKWIDKKQARNKELSVGCPQCQMSYVVKSAPLGWYVRLVDVLGGYYARSLPFIGLSALAYTGYLSLVAYGAYAVYQVMGVEEARQILFKPWTWRHWIGLPLIPLGLVASRFKLYNSVLPMLPMVVLDRDLIEVSFPPRAALIITLLPWAKLLYQSLLWACLPSSLMSYHVNSNVAWLLRDNPGKRSVTEYYMSLKDGLIVRTRVFITDIRDSASVKTYPGPDILRKAAGALLFPGVASLVGQLLFCTLVKSHFHRTIIGGCLSVLVKDIGAITYHYLKRHQPLRKHVVETSSILQPS
jgi:hypothetical protein